MATELNTSIRLVIADDHAIVRQGIASFLSSIEGIEVVAEAESCDQLKQLLATCSADVVLLDLHFGETQTGIETTQYIKTHYPSVQVIVLTSYHQDDYIIDAFQAGALSYVLKDINPEHLAQAVLKAAKGEAFLSPVVAKKLLEISQNALCTPAQQLTMRELEVLKLIATGKSNAEIAETLFIHIKTVRTHVSHILAKLDLRDRTQAAIHAWRTGLIKS